MGGGGKGGTSTTTVSIPPEVLARYNAVNARAEEVAKTPFQPYGGEFVAPMNTVQQQGVGQTQQYANAAQPYYQQAAAQTQASSAPLTAEQIQRYQSPYVQAVVDPTLRALRQAQGIDLAKQQAQQIQTGAYGGDRAGLSRAMLQGQQELAQAQAISPLYQQAYQNALQTAQQQQQMGLTGAQQLAGIGTGAQQAGLQGAQAVIGAGTLGQQTQQALDTAQYQQFLQERGYPFQTTQFLANIAEGTGALSGSTTTSTQPTSFFSDERLKTDIKKIATAKNGLPIYSFKYKDDPKTTHIGFIAQDVEKEHPEAVGLSGGYKTVDYGKALREARAMGGGLLPSSMGGGVWPSNVREEFAAGGSSMDDIVAMQARMYGMGGDQGGAGQSSAILPYVNKQKAGLGIPNVGRDPYRRLLTGSTPSQQQQYGFRQAMGDISSAGSAASTLSSGWDKLTGKDKPKPSDGGVKPAATTGTDQPQIQASSPPPAQTDVPADKSWWEFWKAHGGGVMPHHFAKGGDVNPYTSSTDDPMEEVVSESEATKDRSEGMMPKPDGSRGSGGGGGGLGSALGTVSGLYGAAKGIGSLLSFLPFFETGGRVRYYNGGLVPRHGYQTDGTVQSDQAPQYKVQPIELEQMPDYQQALLKEIYGPESGGKYNIRYGGVGSSGKTFDVTGPHPNIPERRDDGRTSTAAGAGQFLGSTWQDITGGAPMLPGYQNAATLALAQRDYKARTGRDLNADLQERGVTPEIKSALAPTWESFAKQGYGKQTAQQYPFQQQVEGGLGAAKDLAARMVPTDYKGRAQVLDPETGKPVRDRTWGDFLTSRDFILPLMAGLGTMASSPSRYLGAAILQGLGGAAQAYQGVQKSQIDRDTALAQQIAGLQGVMPPYVTGQIEGGGLRGQPITESLPKSLTGVEAPGGGRVGGYKSSIMVDDNPNAYNYTVGPTQSSVANTAKLLGTNNLNPINVQTQLGLQNKTADNESERQRVEQRLAESKPDQIAQTRNILGKSLQTLVSLPPDPKNPLYPQTNAAAQLYNWLGSKVGLSPVNEKEISAQALLDKFAALDPQAFGKGGDSHAGYIVQGIQNSIPSAKTPDEALRKIFSSMITANQNRGDFVRYVPEYRNATGGLSLNLMNSFDRDIGQGRMIEQQKLEDAMKPRYTTDASGKQVRQDSPIEILMKNPNNPAVAREFDKLYNQPGLARSLIGG